MTIMELMLVVKSEMEKGTINPNSKVLLSSDAEGNNFGLASSFDIHKGKLVIYPSHKTSDSL